MFEHVYEFRSGVFGDFALGQVAARVATASEHKLTTARQQEAVSNQPLHWQSARRILNSLAKGDVRVLDAVRLIKQ